MSEQTNEAQAVMADAQFGTVAIMRPVADFETEYEGVSATQPIYLFPQGDNVDPLAAQVLPGYDPTLARGLAIPMGARVLLWLPNLFFGDPAQGYEWTLIWRMRTLFDFRQGRTRHPWHLPQDQGASDTTAPAGQQTRVVIPAAYNTLKFVQSEPANEASRAINNIHSEDLEAATDTMQGPRINGGGGAIQPIQQGVLDPGGAVPNVDRPQFMTHDTESRGDELIIAVRRDAGTIANWAFATTDLRFSQFLGSGTGTQQPQIGVYVMTGTAP